MCSTSPSGFTTFLDASAVVCIRAVLKIGLHADVHPDDENYVMWAARTAGPYFWLHCPVCVNNIIFLCYL